MGCLSHRKKQTEGLVDQKWEYINLQDFRSKGCGTGFAYGYLWLLLLISVAVYAVDIFTAINLIVFNRWSSKIDPAISFDVSKWIFSICIILSFINLGYEGIRAYRVMKRGNVAECFLDPLAVRWESMRFGAGQGFRRFLVFAELTKSKKGIQYMAIFTYFNFQSWIRVILCSGPRQVLNAFTLKAVYEAKLAVSEKTVEDSLTGFFDKIKTLAEEDYQQALILSGMCFTVVVWAISALFLLTAFFFWVFFLWHWIPRADGGLRGYCARKVTKKLVEIVTKKVNKALAKGEAQRMRAELHSAKGHGDEPPLNRAGTLPTLPNVGPIDSRPPLPMLGRNDTMATLPPYTSRPGTPGGMDQKRPVPTRSNTQATTTSYSSRVPLMGAQSDMGYSRAASPAPTMPDIKDINLANYPPPRSVTANSNYGRHSPLSNLASPSQASFQPRFTESPAPMHSETMPPFPPPVRSSAARTMDSYMGGPARDLTPSPAPRQYQAYNPNGRSSPALTEASYSGGPSFPQQRSASPAQPMRSATGPINPRVPQFPPQRNFTSPIPAPGPEADHLNQTPPSYGMRGTPVPRSGTPQSRRHSPQGYDVESQRDRGF